MCLFLIGVLVYSVFSVGELHPLFYDEDSVGFSNNNGLLMWKFSSWLSCFSYLEGIIYGEFDFLDIIDDLPYLKNLFGYSSNVSVISSGL